MLYTVRALVFNNAINNFQTSFDRIVINYQNIAWCSRPGVITNHSSRWWKTSMGFSMLLWGGEFWFLSNFGSLMVLQALQILTLGKSNNQILGSKSLPNMRVNYCLRQSFLVLREFQKLLKFLANVSSILRTLDDASEPPCMFGKLLEPKIRMLNFAIIFDIRILHKSFTCAMKTLLY